MPAMKRAVQGGGGEAAVAVGEHERVEVSDVWVWRRLIQRQRQRR